MNFDFVVCDLETNGLRPSTIFMVGVQDLISGDYKSYVGPDGVAEALWRMSEESKMVVGHFFNGYDAKVCRDLGGVEIPQDRILDTVEMSRDLCKLKNHKLENWGDIIGLPKLPKPLFEVYSKEMDVYCERDVRLNTAVFGFLYRLYIGADHSTLKFNNALIEQNKSVLERSIIA